MTLSDVLERLMIAQSDAELGGPNHPDEVKFREKHLKELESYDLESKHFHIQHFMQELLTYYNTHPERNARIIQECITDFPELASPEILYCAIVCNNKDLIDFLFTLVSFDLEGYLDITDIHPEGHRMSGINYANEKYNLGLEIPEEKPWNYGSRRYSHIQTLL